MEPIGGRRIRSYLRRSDSPERATNTEIRHDPGHRVTTFLDLAKKVAALQFNNPQYVFLFRGQGNDYKNKDGNSSLKPSLFRPAIGNPKLPGEQRLTRRFEFLKQAERRLVESYGEVANDSEALKIKRQRILRWSILQHYEICYTPLLDVTQSLRVAVSFAAGRAAKQAFIYVIGVPNLSGTTTVSGEAGLLDCLESARRKPFVRTFKKATYWASIRTCLILTRSSTMDITKSTSVAA